MYVAAPQNDRSRVLPNLMVHALLTLLAILGINAAARGDDWPAQAHDGQRSNVTQESLQFPLTLAWQWHTAKPRPAWTAYDSHFNRMDFDYAPQPVAADGRVFVGSSADDTIRAFAADSGALLWRFITGGPVRFAPQIDSGRCFAASDDGWIYCLDAATGALIWRFQAAPQDEQLIGQGRMISRWPIRTGLLVEEGVVYAVAGMWPSEGIFVYALHADSGKVVWLHDTGGFVANSWGDRYRPGDAHTQEFTAAGITPQGALLTSTLALVVPQGDNSPTQFNKRTGAVLSFVGRGDGGTWMTIDKADGDRFYRISAPRDGRRGWNLVITAAGLSGSPGGYRPERMTVAEMPDSAIRSQWKISAVASGGKLFVRPAYQLVLAGQSLIAGEDGRVTAYDVTQAAAAYAPRVASQPALINTEQLPQLWQAQVQGQSRGLAVADGRLIVTTDSGGIYCFAPLDAGHRPTVSHDPSPALQLPPPSPATTQVLRRLDEAGIDRGFVLVVGDPQGKLAVELAAASALQVVLGQRGADQAAALRQHLLATTPLYGERVSVAQVDRFDRLSFAQYFANAVVVAGPVDDLSAMELYRVLRPSGGVLLAPGLGQEPAQALLHAAGAPAAELQGLSIVRGRLPGARDWDHPGPDQRVKWPLRPLWFGGPPLPLIANDDVGNHPPVAAQGRYFVTAEETLTAVDAYNGLTLWTRPIPSLTPYLRKTPTERFATDTAPADRTIRDRERLNQLQRQVSADADSVYLTLGQGHWRGGGVAVIQLDARTGRQRRIFGPLNQGPRITLAEQNSWTLSHAGKTVGELSMKPTPAGLALTLVTTDPVANPREEWDLFFDLRPPAQRYGLYERGVMQIIVRPALSAAAAATWRPGTGQAHPSVEVTGEHGADGTRTTVVLPWSGIEDLAGGRPASFGFAATLNAYSDGPDQPMVQTHLFADRAAHGINNGWANVLLGDEPTQSPAGGVLGGTFEQRPPAWPDQRPFLETGQIDDALRDKPRIHPLTGEFMPRIFRTGTGACGQPVFSTTTRFGRTMKEAVGIYDFDDDSGLRFFGGVASNCGQAGGKDINMVAALGVLIFSDARVHCYCVTPFRTSLVLAPAERRLHEDWAIFHDRNANTSIRQAHINLGAPGDRRDDQGNLWLAYPGSGSARINPSGTVFPLAPGAVMGMVFDAPPTAGTIHIPLQVSGFTRNPGAYAVNADRVAIAGTDRPWLYTSGMLGLRQATLDLNRAKPLISTPASGPMPARAPIATGQTDAPPALQPQAKLPFTNTQLFVSHDDEHLYLALHRGPNVNDRLGKPRAWSARAAGQDAPVWQDDSFEMFLSDSDAKSVVHLGISASGARFDALAKGAAAADSAWNGPWKSVVTADDKGFIAQITVPWSTLAQTGLDKQKLALNFQVNQTNLDGYAPTYPSDHSDVRMANPKDVLAESLLSLGQHGRQRCVHFVPVGLGTAPQLQPMLFTVRLHFAELNNVEPGQRVFDIKLQGQTVQKQFDAAAVAGGHAAVVREFSHVPATESLVLEFVPAGAARGNLPPTLSAIEIQHEADPVR